MSNERSYDVVLWGATGFTGKLVAEYLAKRYGALGDRLRWAIAGRRREKLESVRKQLAIYDPRASTLPILIGRSDDPASLHAIAKQTRTVCAAAGPFATLGSNMVAACVDARTHYCDITGEVQWVRQMIARHHDVARAHGTRIVHCCGYDSVPSDLGVFALEELARERCGAPAQVVKSVMAAKAPGLSGGTIASLLNVFDEADHDPALLAMLRDPLALCREDGSIEPRIPEPRGAHFDAELGGWVAPFMMAAVNVRIVHRSNALLGHAYGPEFSYIESVNTGRGVCASVAAGALAAGLVGAQAAMAKPFSRRLIRRVLPTPGAGPSPEQRAASHFCTSLVGQIPTPTGLRTLRAKFAAQGDPGYGATATMVAESALCLSLDADKLPAHGGVLTPASAMGTRLSQRLRRAGFTIEASEG